MSNSTLTPYFEIFSDGSMKLRQDLKFRVQKLNPKAKAPIREHATDAGIDFYSAIKETIPPGGRRIIPTGLRVAIPECWSLILKDKSGLAKNNGVHVLAGVIDSNFRGELEVLIVNLSSERLEILEGQKITQGLLVPIGLFDIQVVSQISTETDRGAGGFGSTGII